jgi:hypothetical protein
VTTAHEPRRGPGTHLSTEELSALAEGAQPGAEGVAGHLEDCAACRAEVDALSELLAALADLEAPAAPPEVAIRIDAALARESAARAAGIVPPEVGGDPEAAGHGESSVSVPGGDAPQGARERSPSSPRRGRRTFPRGLGWALASLVLVAGGLTLAVDLTSSSTGSSSGTAASGAAPLTSAQKDSSNPMAQRQVVAPETLAATSPLALWVRELLPSRSASAAESAPEAGPADSPCFSNPRFSGYTRLLTASGDYGGTAATLVVYANGKDSSTVYAVAYAAPCTTSNYSVLAEGVVAR